MGRRWLFLCGGVVLFVPVLAFVLLQSPSRECLTPGNVLEDVVVTARALEPLADYSTVTPMILPDRMSEFDVAPGACEFVFLSWDGFDSRGGLNLVQIVRYSEQLESVDLDPFRTTGVDFVTVGDGVELTSDIGRVPFSGLYMFVNDCLVTLIRPGEELDVPVWKSHLDEVASRVCGPRV